MNHPLKILAAVAVAAGMLVAPQSAGARADERRDDAADAKQLTNEAVAEARQMLADPGLRTLLARAKGVYLVPEFGRGALIVGGRGGAGLVVVRDGEGWTPPAYYNFGGVSVGLQAGGSGGRIAFLLMSPEAVDAFRNRNKISLNADAGLSIINYSANAQASWGKGDIILWSDTAGAFAGGAISVTNVSWDEEKNRAVYGADVTPRKLLGGAVESAQGDALSQVLP